MAEETHAQWLARQARDQAAKHRKRMLFAAAIAIGALALGVAQVGYVVANWDVVTLDCADLSEPPTALRLELRNCVADLSDIAIERKGSRVQAVYAPVHAPGDLRPSPVIVRTMRREMVAFANEGGDPAEVAAWRGPRTFEVVRAMPFIGGRKVSDFQLGRALRGEAEEFAVVEETSIGQWFLPLGAFLFIGLAAMAAVFYERKSWRRHLGHAEAAKG